MVLQWSWPQQEKLTFTKDFKNMNAILETLKTANQALKSICTAIYFKNYCDHSVTVIDCSIF